MMMMMMMMRSQVRLTLFAVIFQQWANCSDTCHAVVSWVGSVHLGWWCRANGRSSSCRKSSVSVQCAMLKACDACAVIATVPLRKTFRCCLCLSSHWLVSHYGRCLTDRVWLPTAFLFDFISDEAVEKDSTRPVFRVRIVGGVGGWTPPPVILSTPQLMFLEVPQGGRA